MPAEKEEIKTVIMNLMMIGGVDDEMQKKYREAIKKRRREYYGW